MTKSSACAEDQYGHLIRLVNGTRCPDIMFLKKDVERDEARSIATSKMNSPGWIGPKQAIYIYSDGSVELWET